jgi:penicillin-binding protein 1B
MLALLLEMRYGKPRILEAYLNEIYMGAGGPVNLIGLGAAARAYFGKDPARLGLDEAALLAGMIRSPGEYGPVDHPEAAVARRNEVLARMAERQWISAERAAEAAARPLRIAPLPPTVLGPAPHFALAVAREASERFGIEELADRGYDLHSTLRLPDQLAAQEALERGLEAAARRWGVRPSSGAPPAPLEGALVSADPRDGAILAYLGGRDWAASQFDRAAQAHRQAGSAFKPVVYAAAIAAGVAYPSNFLSDSPIVVRQAETEWRPRNYDRRFHGMVSMRAALEQSLNIPTVRLAVATGLPRVRETARAMGVTSPIESVPALALGSLEMTPMEMTTVYGTLAGGGVRPTLHGIRTLTDSSGDTVPGPPPPAPRRALQPEVSYLVTVMLQGALARGTGAGARLSGVEGPLAGKTGTTNDRRDSWFAGYSPDRVTVVWVGHDDNSRTNLSGARAALPIWSRFLASLPAGRRAPGFTPPPSVVHAEIDPVSGFLATESCPQVVSEAFPEGRLPHLTCPLHPVGYSFAAGVAAPAGPFAPTAPMRPPAAFGGAGIPPLQREVHEVEVTDEGTSEILIERAAPP